MSDTTPEGPGDSATPVNNAPVSTRQADIDPVLIHDRFIPAQTETGGRIPEVRYASQLETIKTRQPLLDACVYFNIRHAKRANLAKLRGALVHHWYGTTSNAESSVAISKSGRRVDASPPSSSCHVIPGADTEVDDDALVRQYDVGDGVGQEIFGALGTGGLEEIGDDEDEGADEDEDEEDLGQDDVFKKFQTKTRVSAAERWEANRRAGGRKTQKSVAKCWKARIFVDEALSQGKIRDEIVDEHSLLLFIEFSANRCRRDRRGEYIPNTRIGASQIKKEFFGALRIRKVQDAQDPSLTTRRPATTVHRE